MKKTATRILALFMSILMLSSFAACGANGEKKDDTAKDTITVTDMMDREVAIPKDTAKNTVCSTYGVMTPFFVTLKMSDRVLAATFKNKGFLRKVDETIVNTGDIGNISVDTESLASYNPSVYMCKIGESEKIDSVANLGINVVTMSAENPEEIMKTYQLCGKIFGVEDRANEIIKYFNDQLAEIKAITDKIPEDQKKTALVMGSEIGRIAGDDMLQTRMLELAGAKSVVKGINNSLIWANIGAEKIFDLNPEYIYITSSNVLEYEKDDIMKDSTWSAVKAVKDDHVYQIPAKMDSWDNPGPDFILGIYYMLHTMYPEYLDDAAMQQKIDDFYQLMYGKTFDGATLGY